MKTFIISLFTVISLLGWSQNSTKKDFSSANIFEKKLLFGFAVNNSWANYYDLKDSSFYRPSLGMHARMAYYPKPFIGINVGLGIQQRGMGIYTVDVDKSIGNPDSTGRLRYKSATIDAPIEIVFRPKLKKCENLRPHLGLGTTLSYMRKAQRIWKSVDDGFHQPTDITNSFKSMDVLFRASVGLDVNVPGNNLFRVQGVFEKWLSSYLYQP